MNCLVKIFDLTVWLEIKKNKNKLQREMERKGRERLKDGIRSKERERDRQTYLQMLSPQTRLKWENVTFE